MSKITNDGLTRSGWHRMLYGCSHMATVGVKRLNKRLMLLHIYMKQCENLNTLILYRTESHLRWTEFFTTCPAYGSIIHVKLTIQPVSFHTVYSTHSPEICVKPGPVFAAIETQVRRASLQHCSTKASNTLPLNVRQTSNTQTLKRRLKTFLFCKSYSIPYQFLSWQTAILRVFYLKYVCFIILYLG